MVNREIKFRAWHEASNVFFNWDDISINGRNNCIIHINEGVFEINGNINPVIIEQYTGLKDKNGKEIYENDVISDGNTKYRVYSVLGGFAIKAPYWASCMEDFKFGDELIIQPLADAQTISYIKESCTVIGNIHENPELLNK